MSNPRLTLAVDSGLFTLPETGEIAVFGASSDDDLSRLPRDRTLIIQRHKPEHDAMVAAGWQVTTTLPDEVALSVVFLPRAKAEVYDTVARAAAITSDTLVIDGAKTDGIASLLKALRQRGAPSEPLSKAHGKIFPLPPCDLSDWIVPPSRLAAGHLTAPGIFSADGVDPASQLLIDSLPDALGADIADFGAGWGYLAHQLLRRDNLRSVTLLESDHVALDCARENISDPRASFHWADATTWQAPRKYDAVVMNPPFHNGRAAEPALGRDFIRAAAENITPNGHLWMVANRHLPYEATLAECFARVEEITGNTRFKVFAAARPRRRHR